MFCPNCGTQLPDGSKFCDNCGERVESVQNIAQPARAQTGAVPPQTQHTASAPPKRRSRKLLLIPLALVLVLGIAAAVLLGREPAEDTIGGADRSTQIFVTDEDNHASSAAKPDPDEEATGADGTNEPDEASEPSMQAPVDAVPSDTEHIDHPAVTMAAVVDAGASSVLDEYGMSHLPGLAVDGDRTTGWVEGVSGNGIGESLHLVLDDTYQVSGFTICAGYHKSSDLYYKNARPSKLEITFSDGSSQFFELDDRMEPQTFSLLAPVDTDSVVFTIRDVYAGNKYQDTVISEIELF